MIWALGEIDTLSGATCAHTRPGYGQSVPVHARASEEACACMRVMAIQACSDAESHAAFPRILPFAAARPAVGIGGAANNVEVCT